MYAVIETGGKQYRVEVGTELEVEKLEVGAGDTVTLERVLLVADGEGAAIGRPVVDGATVSAEVVRQDRADKVIVFKYRPKARRRVKKGHRQDLTVLRISDITFNGKSAAAAVSEAKEAAKSERERLEEAAARQAAADAALAAKLAARTEKAEKAETAAKAETAETAEKAETAAKAEAAGKAPKAAKPPRAAKAEGETVVAEDEARPRTTRSRAAKAAAETPEASTDEGPEAKADEAPAEAAKPKRRTTKKDE